MWNSTDGTWSHRPANGMVRPERRCAHGSGKNRRVHRPMPERGRLHPGRPGREAGNHRPGGLQMGDWSFPNKRILRNNLCLPACKLLYLDKREKNFLLTDIISDIIIVRN